MPKKKGLCAWCKNPCVYEPDLRFFSKIPDWISLRTDIITAEQQICRICLISLRKGEAQIFPGALALVDEESHQDKSGGGRLPGTFWHTSDG